MSTEKIYRIVWKADSPNPGHIESTNYKETELPDHNREEVLGPYREFVEVVPGSLFYRVFVDSSDVSHTDDTDLLDLNIAACTYNWETNGINMVYKPPMVWDDVRSARNNMLKGSDNMFNVDTPDPLKTEWVEYRQLLRDLITRELAAGRTPDTVFWHDYVPPFPKSARIGVPDSEKPNCVWYKGENTYPPEAIIGSPESLAVAAEAERLGLNKG
jgi:hypothetical protein